MIMMMMRIIRSAMHQAFQKFQDTLLVRHKVSDVVWTIPVPDLYWVMTINGTSIGNESLRWTRLHNISPLSKEFI